MPIELYYFVFIKPDIVEIHTQAETFRIGENDLLNTIKRVHANKNQYASERDYVSTAKMYREALLFLQDKMARM